MVQLPPEVNEEWEKREGPAVLTTVDTKAVPNTIYVSAIRKYGDDRFVIADSAFCKTRQNIADGSPGSLLFISKDGAAYQIKGAIEYHQNDDVFNSVLEWADPEYELIGAAVVLVEEVYKGAELLAG